MGSVAAEQDSSEKPITVLITGFEPFKRDYPVNPSWEIARSLPSYLPPLRAKTTATTTIDLDSPPPSRPLPPVRLLTHPTPIRVTYATVRALVPSLWHLNDNDNADDDNNNNNNNNKNESEEKPPRRPKIDLALHIGMAGPRLFYSVERRGHRAGYVMPDVDGAVPPAGDREGLPEELESALDVGDVVRRWRGFSPRHLDLRISEDAGHYLCDYIYYESLVHLEQAGEERKVLFLHVPSDPSEHSVALGRELVLQLVRAMVESEMVRRAKAGTEGPASS